MAINLKLGDRLAIIKDGVKKGLTPQLAIQQYQVNKDGGYNNWKNQFKLTTGVNPDLDDTYNYELFFKENPEAAKLLLLGKVSPEILQMYKTPQAIQKEKQVLLQRQRGNINSLMDYSLYEKLINDYMNKSVSTPMYAAGGPISINIYANGTSELATSDNPNVTEIGMIPEKWSRSIAPDFIEVTPEELQYFKRATMNVPDAVYSDESVPLEYKDVASKHTKWVSVPWDYIEERSPNSRRSKGSTHAAYYMLEDVDEDNPKKYYRLYRVRESSPEGRAYDYWKRQQAYEDRQSREYEYNYGDGEWLNIGTSEVLPQVTVTYNPETKNYVEEPKEEIITSENTSKPIADSIPVSETSPYAQGNSETSYYNPFNAPDGELNVPNNNPYGTEGVSGGSSFGSGTEGIKMPDVFDMNIQDIPYEDLLFEPYQWQLEDLEYLNPPGYVPIPNWEVSQIYDSGAEGVDFADFMMRLAGYGSRNNTRDLLMQQLMLPKDYFADPYAGNNYNDARSFYDAYNNDPFTKIQRESNGIPLYANGGKINIFGPGGFTYIPDNQQNMVVDPFEFEGIRYGWLPNGGTGEDVYKEHNDRNGVYVRWDNDNNKWAKTTVPRDLGNIKNYFANRHNELATYDNNATAANAYDANSELVEPNIERYAYWDPVNKLARWRQNKQELDRKWFTNEDATRFLTNAGLTLMGGAAAWTKPLHFALGMLGMEAGNNYADWLINQSDSSYSSWSEMALKEWNLPDFAADLSNPGGWIGGGLAGFGIKSPKLESSISDMYNFGKQITLDKSFRNNIIGDFKSNLQLYNLKNGLPKSEYLQIIEDANPYPNRLAQYNFKIPGNEYTESAKQHLNVGPILDWKSFKKSVKDANELVFHGNINKLRKVHDKIKATDEELRNISNNQDKLEYDIAMAADVLYDIQQKHFLKNPYYDTVKLSDLTQADINDAIQTELPNNYPYDVVYNNGEFLFIPKGSADVEFSIPQFGTENWITGTTSSIPYYNLGILGKQISIGRSPYLGIFPPETKGIPNTSFGQMQINHSPEILIPLEGTGYSTMLNAAELTYKTSNLAGETSKTYETAPTLSKEAKEVTLKNMEYVEQKELPGFKTFGSAKTSTEGAVAKAAGDIDGYMAKSDFDKLPQDKRSRMSTVNGDTYQYQIDSTGKKKYAVRDKNGNIVTDSKGKQNDWGVIDINIVDVDKNGYGNKRAELIFRQFFPEEYHKAVIELNTNKKHNGRLPIIDMNGKPLTDKLLMEAYDPLVGSIIDAMEANFLHNPTYKGKHAARWFNYLIGDRPDSISKALSQVTKMMYGKNGVKLPKMKFGTPQENELILIELGYPKEAAHIIAKDNAKMQNALDYWYIADRGTYRQVYPDSSGSTIGTPQTINRNLTNWNISTGGGTAAGGGLNTTIEGNSNAWGSIAGRTQPKIIGLKDGMTPRLVIDEVDYQMGISPIQQSDINALNAMGITHNLLVGDDISLLHKVLSPSKLEWEWNPGDELIFNQYLNMTGRRGIVNRQYGEGRFWGSGPIDPITDALGINSSQSSAYDIMSLANRKLFLEQLGAPSVAPRHDAAYIINRAAKNKAQPGYDKAIQEFRKNSKEYLEMEKEIDKTQKELDKLGRDFSATIDAQQKYDKLELKLYEIRLKRARVLEKLIKGTLAGSVAGLGAAATYYIVNDNDNE